MKKLILLLVIIHFLSFEQLLGQNLTASFVSAKSKFTNQITLPIDSAIDNSLSFLFEYKGDGVTEEDIKIELMQGILDSRFIAFTPFSIKLKNSAVINVPFSIPMNFTYKDIIGKSIFFKIKPTSATIPIGGSAMIQINFKKKVEEETKEPVDEFFRLNLGTNFDYLASNPLKLLYADASIMSPTAFTIKNWKQKDMKFGFYGRLYQFQGLSESSKRGNDPFFFEADNANLTGKDTVLKTLNKDTLLVKRSFFNRNADLIEKRSYGMAIGITTPIVYNVDSKFYMSLGIHFEGMVTNFERKNIYTKIYTDTLKLSKLAFLNHPQQDPQPISRTSNFTGTIGVSLPVVWHFSAFELKVLPAISLVAFDDMPVSSLARKGFAYSVHAVLTEIKETGFNIGCELRGYSTSSPSTFSIFVAKTFNMKKLGDFLKI